MRWAGLLLLITLALTACGPAVQSLPTEDPIDQQGNEPSELQPPDADTSSRQVLPEEEGNDSASVRINNRLDDPREYSYVQLIPFDGIPPIYEPRFVGAEEAPLNDDELVIGIVLEEKAKAYPITVLRAREMVNDELAGIPILVTW